MLRAAVFRLLRLSCAPAIVRATIQRRRVTVLLYHDPPVDLFANHLEVLQRHYTVIPLRALVEASANGRLAELPPKSIVITFDDGYARNYQLKPLLERTGAPITIFICSDIVGTRRSFWFLHVTNVDELARVPDAERIRRLQAMGIREDSDAGEREALSRREIRDLSGPLVDFQSHTATHPFLPRCSDEKAWDEISRARHDLEREYGFAIYALAYPNGDYSDRDARFAREAGYRCALTIESGFNTAATDPYRMKRIPIDDHDGVDELLVKASGVWGVVRGGAARAARTARGPLRVAPRTPRPLRLRGRKGG